MASETIVAREGRINPINAVRKDPENIPSWSRETREDRIAYNKIIDKYKVGDAVPQIGEGFVITEINRFTNDVWVVRKASDGGRLPGAPVVPISAREFAKRYMK